MNTLKQLHDLSYDISGLNSGLITWYNQLIDKSYDDLNTADVCRMIRQDILKDIAIQKAVDLFLIDPYNGEYCDGELLNVLISVDLKLVSKNTIQRLKATLNIVRNEYTDF